MGNNNKRLFTKNPDIFAKFKKSGQTEFLILKKRICPGKTGRMATLDYGKVKSILLCSVRIVINLPKKSEYHDINTLKVMST